MFKLQLAVKQQLPELERSVKTALHRVGVTVPLLRLQRQSGPLEDELTEKGAVGRQDQGLSEGQVEPSARKLNAGIIVAIAASAVVLLVVIFALLRISRRRRALLARNAYFSARTAEEEEQDDDVVHGDADNVVMDSDWAAGPAATAEDWLEDGDSNRYGRDDSGNAL